jgi:hypothetical protein
MSRLKVFTILGLSFVFAIAGCASGRKLDNPQPRSSSISASPGGLLKIAVLLDHSESAEEASVPQFEEAHLRQLITLITEHGGEIALFSVRATAHGGLKRLRIAPPLPQQPKKPNTSKETMSQEQRLLTKYRAEKSAWDENERQRLEQAQADTAAFLEAVRELLFAPRTEKYSDVVGSLRRVDTYFLEDESSAESRKAMLCLTDLADTKSKKVYRLRSRPLVILVTRQGISDDLLPGVATQKSFEGPDAALRFVQEWAAQKAASEQ